jgi:serine/threonine protein kinase
MPIAIGTQLGSHEITGLLGKGGMGEVYRARDLKLKREVAIKILPEEFSRDTDRVGRFQREAEVLASLNHPNIAGIHELAEANGSRFLVLELVEGETLADRIARGPIPVEETLTIAKQICEALEAAHEKGIIHRDLKPANVKITTGGTVKVLDFGLAKALQGSPQNTALSNSPTMLSGTMGGMIIGTAAYMSPEQAKGRSVDRRTDIFAFGCVLFEMLSGEPAFPGEDVTEILGRVVTAEPDWNKLPPSLPSTIERLIRRALKKDGRQRLADIHDAKLDIEDAINALISPAGANSTIGNKRGSWAWAIAAIALVAVSIPAIRHLLENPPPEPAELRVEINTQSTPAPLEFALSPNGRYLVYVASGGGPQELWLRALDKTVATPLQGSEGADYPFWSPDSRSIAFYAAGKLKRLDIAGGLPEVLANSSASFGGAWNADGVILFNAAPGALSRISASGGTPMPATTLGPQQVSHRFPSFLPDGRHFLFYSSGRPGITGVYLASLDGEAKFLTIADSTGLYLAPDMIAFGRGTTLSARHLDLKKGELTGEPVRVADFSGSGILGLTGVSVSSDGKIAFRGGGEGLRRLKWYDRSGKFLAVAGEPGTPSYPELSPDETQIAMARTVQNNTDVWLMDLVRGIMTRFTVDPAADTVPIWSPDGKQIAFTSARLGPFNIYVKRTSNSAQEDILMESPNAKSMQDWSKDNRFYLYLDNDPKTGRDLWARPVAGSDQKPFAVANSVFVEQNGQFSPNGHWVAYETNESDAFQIVVQSFPERSFKRQVSQFGGNQPRWRADGKELYFVALDGKMMAAPITDQGSTLSVGNAVPLFQATPAAGIGFNRQEYVVTRDGRFLINQPAETSSVSPITLILNWKPKS